MTDYQSEKSAGELRVELRALRQSNKELAEAVDALVEELDNQTNGQGPPEHASAAREKCQSAKDCIGKPVPENENIAPPWEREGYDSKQEWLEDKNSN